MFVLNKLFQMKIAIRILFFSLCINFTWAQKQITMKQAESFKNEVMNKIKGQLKTAQVMVDKVFSFGELGFQETETSNYICGILEKNGFKVTKGISGVTYCLVGEVG
jgi:aminobenzoyl-glutamate utilization protein B